MITYRTLCANQAELAELRAAIRDFLRPTGTSSAGRRGGTVGGWDPEFSVRLGNACFVGVTIPCRYGGRRRADSHPRNSRLIDVSTRFR